MTRKFGEHPTDGKGLERVSAALKADSERSQAALASNGRVAVKTVPAKRARRLADWAAQEIERLARERDSLLAAIGEHVTVRSEQYAQIQRLRAGLQQVRAILRSDSVEYDDLRNIDQIIETALSGEPGSAVETNAFAAELLDVRAICDDRDRFRSLADRAGMLLRSAPIHHYGRAYDRWKLQCEAWRVERETGEPCKHPPEWRTGTQCGLCFADESAVETSTVHGPCPQCGSQWTDVRIMTPVPCKCRAAEKAGARPLTAAEASAVESFGEKLSTIHKCQCGGMPSTTIRGQLYCEWCGNYRAVENGNEPLEGGR